MRFFFIFVMFFFLSGGAQAQDVKIDVSNPVINPEQESEIRIFNMQRRYLYTLIVTKNEGGEPVLYELPRQTAATVKIDDLPVGRYSLSVIRQSDSEIVANARTALVSVSSDDMTNTVNRLDRSPEEIASEREARRVAAETSRFNALGVPGDMRPHILEQAVRHAFNQQVFGPYCRRGAVALSTAGATNVYRADWDGNACRISTLNIWDTAIQEFSSARVVSCEGNVCRAHIYVECAFRGYLNASLCNPFNPRNAVAHADIIFGQHGVTNIDFPAIASGLTVN